MRARVLFVAGLALFWPFLQGPYFSTFFGAGAAGTSAALPFVFNGWVVAACALIAAAGSGLRGGLGGVRSVVGCALSSTVLLALGSLGVGGEALRWVAAPVTALAFGALSCAWASLARGRCASAGRAAVFFEVAVSYVCCYGLVFAVEVLPGASQAPAWALCPAFSAALWVRVRGHGTAAPSVEEEAPGSGESWPALPLAVACVALVSSVLAGLFSDVPAHSYGPSALCALVLAGFAGLARHRPAWGALAWGLSLVPILMSGFFVMSLSAELAAVGVDVLTLGRRMLWVLYWWLLASGPAGASLRAVALGFAPLYAATRLVIDGLRMGAPGLAADPAFTSLATVAVALVLETASFAVVGLVVAGQMRALGRRAAVPAVPSAPVEAGELRAAACGSIAEEHGLTERERDVLELVSMGYTVQRIAEERGVSQNTVRTHTKGLYRKLDIHSKQEVIELVNARMA